MISRRAFGGVIVGATAAAGAREPYTQQMLRVRVKGKVEMLDLERYTAGVLTGEASVFRSGEALKAMAVAARTFAERFRGRHAAEGYDLCDTTHCQRYDSAPESRDVKVAMTATTGQVLIYQGKPVATYYSLDCGGQLEDAREVWPGETGAYLKSRLDPHCRRAAGGGWHWEVAASQLVKALRAEGLSSPAAVDRIEIVERTESGRAKTLLLGGANNAVRLSASSLRFAVGRTHGFNTVRSDRYRVGVAGSRIVFDGTGVGHGVGLCQRGADQMGLDGQGYAKILSFYFPGTQIAGAPAEPPALVWRRIGGERITLVSTQPTDDAPVLAAAESMLRAAEARLRIQAPPGLAVHVYPAVAAFIEQTGEPGWVAARTAGKEIHLQPRRTLEVRGALESTLRHELTHVLIDSKAAPGLPVWFREGLAEYFSSLSGTTASTHTSLDRDLRQTASEVRARAAYAEARARVASLVSRYGEAAVLSWVSSGLPRDVTNASARQPMTKSR